MQVRAIKARIFTEGEDLIPFIRTYIPTLVDGSILFVTSKIVALSENRTAPVADKTRLITQESEWAVPTKYAWLTIKDGTVMATAGIDESNADGKLILLPKDSFTTADVLRKELLKVYTIKRLGVVITDSRVLPLRAGVTGVAVGYAGFKGVRDYRGSSDIFGRKLKMTQVNIADALATFGVLVMGEGDEQSPLAIVKNAPVIFSQKVDRSELKIDIKDDLYRPLFENLPKKYREYREY